MRRRKTSAGTKTFDFPKHSRQQSVETDAALFLWRKKAPVEGNVMYVMERLNRGAEGRVTGADGAKQTPCGLCQAAMHAIVGG
jgi:hypothetical protein